MNRVFDRVGASRGPIYISLVFAVPFAIIGAAVAYRALWTIVSAETMQQWPVVMATLQDVELKPDGQRTEKVVARYTYAVQGHTYEGKRVSLYGADTPGTSQHRAYERLEAYVSRGTPYPAHVDPANPSNVILMPELRWQPLGFMGLFAALFGGVGFGIIIGGLARLRRLRAEAALVAAHPDEPWRQRLMWPGPRIKSDESSMAIGAVVAAAFVSLCTVPMLLAVPEKWQAGEYFGASLLLVFPAFGAFLIGFAAISVARARRFGETWLELETYPGRQGDRLKGRIIAPAALADATKVPVVISCVRHSSVSGGTRSSRIQTRTLWNHEMAAEVFRGQAAHSAVVVPIDVALPPHLPDSSLGDREWFSWEVAASAKLKGRDFEAEFEVPVYKAR